MKNIFLVLLAVVVLSGCSKDDNKGDFVENTKMLFLKKTESEDAVITYEYNGNKISETNSKISDSEGFIVKKSVFTYEGDLIVKRQSFNEDGTLSPFKEEFFYEDNKLKSYNFIDGDYIRKTTYTHENDGTVSFKKYNVDSKTKIETFIDSGVYTFSNGNLIKYEDSKEIINYEYDDKKNPFKNVTGFSKVIGINSNLNNVLKSTTIRKGSDSSNVSSFEYDYNPDGYPIVQRYFYNGKSEGTLKNSY